MGNKHGKSPKGLNSTATVIDESTATDLPTLPTELWELLLSYCSQQTLTMLLPKVSKMCRKLLNNAWKIKFRRNYPDSKEKPYDDNSWKDFYLGPHHIFPLLGFVISRTIFDELSKTKGAIVKQPVITDHGMLKRVDVESFNFDCEGRSNIFVRLHINQMLDNSYLPLEWRKQGLYWDRSFNAFKALFKRTTRNYHVDKKASATAWMDGQVELYTVARQYMSEQVDLYFKIILKFGHRTSAYVTPTVLDAEGTLESIELATFPPYTLEYKQLADFYEDKIVYDPEE